MARFRERPNVTDITFTEDMLSVCNYEVRRLDDACFRALMNIAVSCAYSMVRTYTDPDPLGRLHDDDEGLSRIANVSIRKWRNIRPNLEPFFVIEGGYWSVKHAWIRIGEEDSRRPPISASLRSEIMHRDKFTCCYCGTRVGPFHCDHIIPVSKGGATVAENLICACAACNLDKRAEDADVWISRRGANVINIAEARGK